MQFPQKNFWIYLISRVFCLDFFKFSGRMCVFRCFLVLSFQVESPNFSHGRTFPKRYFLKPKSEQKSHIFFQITRSTPQVVHLRTTQWTTAGNYRCEVTAEDFETASKSVKAIVVGKFLEAIIITHTSTSRVCIENYYTFVIGQDCINCLLLLRYKVFLSSPL